MVQLHRDLARIRAAGADLVVIGNGTPSFMAGFREQTGWDGPLYTDPSLAAYRAAELKRGVAATFDPRSLGKGLALLVRGGRQGRTQGDPWQQGGVLVVAKHGAIKWQQAAGHAADNATADQIVAALT